MDEEIVVLPARKDFRPLKKRTTRTTTLRPFKFSSVLREDKDKDKDKNENKENKPEEKCQIIHGANNESKPKCGKRDNKRNDEVKKSEEGEGEGKDDSFKWKSDENKKEEEIKVTEKVDKENESDSLKSENLSRSEEKETGTNEEKKDIKEKEDLTQQVEKSKTVNTKEEETFEMVVRSITKLIETFKDKFPEGNEIVQEFQKEMFKNLASLESKKDSSKTAVSLLHELSQADKYWNVLIGKLRNTQFEIEKLKSQLKEKMKELDILKEKKRKVNEISEFIDEWEKLRENLKKRKIIREKNNPKKR